MRQDIDIVDRLRIIWTSMTDMGNAERLEASEEILRLRNELTERIHMCDMRSEKILELTAERDEARRMVCEWHSGLRVQHPQDYAKRRGWDCYEEETR
jgi:hypothetical protein